MKFYKYLAILFLVTTLNLLFADTEADTKKIIYNKYLPDGSLITLVRTKGSSTSANAYYFTLNITEDSDKKGIWEKKIPHFSVGENFDADKALVLHAVDKSKDKLWTVLTFDKIIYFETIKNNSNIWDIATSAKIPTELTQTGVRDASIFTTDTGSYVFLEDYNNVKEYWLASDNPPKMLWTSKNEKSSGGLSYQQWLEHLKSSPDSDPLKQIEKMQKELIKEQEKPVNSADNSANNSNSNTEENNKDDNSVNSNNTADADANKNTQNPDADKTNKLNNHNDDSDDDSTDESSDNASSQNKRNKDKPATDSDSDIFIILGISASVIVLILLISLVILPKIRK